MALATAVKYSSGPERCKKVHFYDFSDDKKTFKSYISCANLKDCYFERSYLRRTRSQKKSLLKRSHHRH